jgi:hypothetical protein
LHATRLRERFEARLPGHHAVEVLSWHGREHAVAIVQLLILAIPFALLTRLLFEQGPDAHATCLRSKVASEGICTSKAPAAAPVVAVLEVTTAYKLLLA